MPKFVVSSDHPLIWFDVDKIVLIMPCLDKQGDHILYEAAGDRCYHPEHRDETERAKLEYHLCFYFSHDISDEGAIFERFKTVEAMEKRIAFLVTHSEIKDYQEKAQCTSSDI